MGERMEIYSTGSTVKLEVKNIPEFYELLRKAENEADQLNETIRQLRNFKIDVEFGMKE